MIASSEITVAQFANGTDARIALGKGVTHNRPRTHHRMTGTQTQCSASLVGLRWLEPYSSSHCSAVRIKRRYALIIGNSIATRQLARTAGRQNRCQWYQCAHPGYPYSASRACTTPVAAILSCTRWGGRTPGARSLRVLER